MRVGRRMMAMLLVTLVSGTGAGMASGKLVGAPTADPSPPSPIAQAAPGGNRPVARERVGEPASPAPSERIEVVNGVRAEPGAFPWVVKLSVGCGGALTHQRYVLTAAHCVTGSGGDTGIVVTAGSTDLRSTSAQRVRSTRVTRAPDFRDVEQGNDWAVIELERELALPTLALASTTAGDSGAFVALGWGATRESGTTTQRHLRRAAVSSVDDRSCGAAYRGLGYGFVASDMLCAAGDGVDTCQGDSGGPMVARDRRGGWVQVGIVSWGHGCARSGYPGVYGQVSTFAGAIHAAIDEMRGPE